MGGFHAAEAKGKTILNLRGGCFFRNFQSEFLAFRLACLPACRPVLRMVAPHPVVRHLTAWQPIDIPTYLTADKPNRMPLLYNFDYVK